MASDTTIFGPFELIREISSGGMGTLYLAKMRGPYQFEKHFIIKLMKEEYTKDLSDLKRFAREARIAAKMHHKNIVQIFDFGSVKGCYYISMEYVDGLNLVRVMNGLLTAKLLLPYSLCAYLIAEIARGLRYMHELRGANGLPIGLVHRDVSPENILVSKEGEVKLSDFGLVKYTGAPTLTNVGKVRGKLPYMAPERVVGRDATRTSDQFSLGLVLHELLTGKRYFSSSMGRKQVQQELIHQAVAPPKDFRKNIPEELNAIVCRATELEPMDRFESIGEMEKQLRAFVHQDPDMTDPEQMLSRLVRALFVGRAKSDSSGALEISIRELLDDICRPAKGFGKANNPTKPNAPAPMAESKSSVSSSIGRFLMSIFPVLEQ
jgi:serine/threonine-protein kinase